LFAAQIDLGGGLRPVKSLDARLAEVAKLGIKTAIIPKVSAPARSAGVVLGPAHAIPPVHLMHGRLRWPSWAGIPARSAGGVLGPARAPETATLQ